MVSMSNHDTWQTLLDNENWSSIPAAWLTNKPGSAALLFRTHRCSDPGHNAGDSNADRPVIHAAPFPLIGTSANRLNSQKLYADAPHPFNFISVYHAAAGQIFYPDETLEFVRSGKSTATGEPIEAIEQFDPVKHFETDAAGCSLIGTFVVLLPRDPKAAFSTSVDKARVQILSLTPDVEILLQSLNKAPSILPRQSPFPF